MLKFNVSLLQLVHFIVPPPTHPPLVSPLAILYSAIRAKVSPFLYTHHSFVLFLRYHKRINSSICFLLSLFNIKKFHPHFSLLPDSILWWLPSIQYSFTLVGHFPYLGCVFKYNSKYKNAFFFLNDMFLLICLMGICQEMGSIGHTQTQSQWRNCHIRLSNEAEADSISASLSFIPSILFKPSPCIVIILHNRSCLSKEEFRIVGSWHAMRCPIHSRAGGERWGGRQTWAHSTFQCSGRSFSSVGWGE